MKYGTANEIIKDVMDSKGFTDLQMAYAIGKQRATDVTMRLKSTNMTFDKAIEMLNILGYEVTTQPVRKGKRPDGQYVFVRSDNV